jgi:hypothetical protein
MKTSYAYFTDLVPGVPHFATWPLAFLHLGRLATLRSCASTTRGTPRRFHRGMNGSPVQTYVKVCRRSSSYPDRSCRGGHNARTGLFDRAVRRGIRIDRSGRCRVSYAGEVAGLKLFKLVRCANESILQESSALRRGTRCGCLLSGHCGPKLTSANERYLVLVS